MQKFVFREPRVAPRSPEEMPQAIVSPSGKPLLRNFSPPDITDSLAEIDRSLEAYGGSRQVEPCIGNLAVADEVRLLSQAFPEEWDEARARNAQILGRAAVFLSGQEKDNHQETPSRTMSQLFKEAFDGEETAKDILTTDSTSEVIEMVCKTGTEMTAVAQVVNGKIVQFGRTTEERQFNTRTTYTDNFPGLDSMSKAEGQNALALETAIAEGKFKPGDTMVEFSLIPDEPHPSLKGSGLFLREVIAIIRTTTLTEDGEVVIKSYLVSGVDQRRLPSIEAVKDKAEEENIEQQALANRFDIAAFRELLQRLGVENTESMSPTDILMTPLFIAPAENGESFDGISISMLYDEIVAQKLKTPVMMGSTELYKKVTAGSPRKLTRQDYEDHFKRMALLQQDLQQVGQDVARRCATRWQEVIADDYAASRLMHKLSEQAVVHYMAVKLVAEISAENPLDIQLDLTVMGLETYNHLKAFQDDIRQGDLEAASRSLILAEKTANGTGCPMPSSMKKLLKQLMGLLEEGESSDEDDDGLGPRVFKCKNGHTNVRPRGDLLKECQTKGCEKGSVGC